LILALKLSGFLELRFLVWYFSIRSRRYGRDGRVIRAILSLRKFSTLFVLFGRVIRVILSLREFSILFILLWGNVRCDSAIHDLSR
jgi:hypothetical protein